MEEWRIRFQALLALQMAEQAILLAVLERLRDAALIDASTFERARSLAREVVLDGGMSASLDFIIEQIGNFEALLLKPSSDAN